MKIKKGDTVEIIAGNYKGVRGTVNSVLRDRNRMIVSGVNIVKKHQRRTGDVRTQVGIIEREASIHVSNVALVCPQCDKPGRVGYQVGEDGSKVRICRRCGEIIE